MTTMGVMRSPLFTLLSLPGAIAPGPQPPLMLVDRVDRTPAAVDQRATLPEAPMTYLMLRTNPRVPRRCHSGPSLRAQPRRPVSKATVLAPRSRPIASSTASCLS
jgi:hypothetical protein